MTSPRRPLLAAALAVALLAGCTPTNDPGSGTSGSGTSGSTTSSSRPGTTTQGSSTATSKTSTSSGSASKSPTSDGGTAGHDHPGIPDCSVDDLPATALQTIADIEAGGPYEFPRNDGVTFRNDEGVLPDEARGYYHEFTVVTPGAQTRGARRIITGGDDPDSPDEPAHWFYTGDHYDSFCEFLP